MKMARSSTSSLVSYLTNTSQHLHAYDIGLPVHIQPMETRQETVDFMNPMKVNQIQNAMMVEYILIFIVSE